MATMPRGSHLRLPLLLVDDVHFPGMEVRLPLPGELLCDLLLRPPEERFLGLVHALGPGRAPVLSRAGTVCRLVDAEADAEGCALLVATQRFAVASQPATPTDDEDDGETSYPQVLVRLLPETPLDEASHMLRSLREELAERLLEARRALGTALPLGPEALQRLRAAPFEQLVNHAAAALDVPPLRKVELLTLPLPDRAAEVAGILRSRTRLCELLRPYRHLAAAAERN
jgi:hypothetical protein